VQSTLLVEKLQPPSYPKVGLELVIPTSQRRNATAQPSTESRLRQIANKCGHALTQMVERWSARLPRRERLVRLGRVVPAIVRSLHPALCGFSATMRAFLRVIGLPASSCGNRAAVSRQEHPLPGGCCVFPNLGNTGGRNIPSAGLMNG
jgi:hypothetical protein